MHEPDVESGHGTDNISLDWSKDITDDLAVVRAFLDDCESSDQGSASMDLGSDTGFTSPSDHDVEDDKSLDIAILKRSSIDESEDGTHIPADSSQPPPLADVLYLTSGDGGRNLSSRPTDGAKPWRQLYRVHTAPLDTWAIHLGDIVKVCLEKDRESYAKISDIRGLDDGRYMVVYTWLYTREEVQEEFETDGIIPEVLRKNLERRWPADATFQYILSTNCTVTLWDTAISRAPSEVVESLCHSSIFSTTRLTRAIWSMNSPRFKWMKVIHNLGTLPTV
ncbi:hypothetical protein PISL3812_09763 [Talaromyces islandicus]|uniref:Uncharacterized protein n=1 Tax=Talaromyces islandicus TaxID=28573 RepID=A0A0U1MAS0_TALIS|nr:hypothetical protein PISL3812_09763 [Talaromyces islandicus]